MGLLTPDPGLLFWMVITFGVVFFILAKYGFPVILKTVEDRKAYIDNSLKAAREANEQLANVKVEGEKILAQAREEQHRILSEAAATRDRIIKDAQLKAWLRTTLPKSLPPPTVTYGFAPIGKAWTILTSKPGKSPITIPKPYRVLQATISGLP